MKILNLESLEKTPVSHNAKIRKQVMLQPGDTKHITQFSRAAFPPGEIAPSHAHDDMSEVFLVESGTGEIQVNEQTYDFSPGTCVLVQPGEKHEIRNTGEQELVVTYFGIINA